jgi:hypothetical protein
MSGGEASEVSESAEAVLEAVPLIVGLLADAERPPLAIRS